MIKHGLSKTSFNKKWYGINQRCNNPKSPNYKIYGGKGVSVLWKSFDEFIKDMYPSYLAHVELFGERNTTIDRIDSCGNYCQENCRWATYKEQNRNKSNVRHVFYNGKQRPLTEVADLLKIKASILFNRIHRGWNVNKAIQTPDTRGKHLI